MTKVAASVLCIFAVAVGTPVSAQTDNFNRANSTTLGTNWTERSNNIGISGQAAVSTDGSSAVATFNGSATNHIAFDLSTGTGSSASVGAATFGYASGTDYYLKLQSNGTNTAFTTYGFYTGNNSSANGQGNMNLNNTTASSGHLDFSYDANNLATIVYTPTGGIAETHTFQYGFTPGSADAGIALLRTATIDNFDATPLAAAPEVGTWLLMMLGFAMSGCVLRRRRFTGDGGVRLYPSIRAERWGGSLKGLLSLGRSAGPNFRNSA